MKAKSTMLMLVGLVACSLAAFAQDTPTATNAAPDASATAPAADAATPAAEASATSTNAVAEPGPTSTIPLIVMDDVPLTDAIKNLARQAGLNYMLDPKIALGQTDAQGRPIAQPTVSIRWENVTAEQALNALLQNNGLQLVEDPKTKISRITLKDPAAPDPLVTRIVQLKYSSPSNIVAAAQTALTDRRSKVVSDMRTSQLVIVATEKELTGLEEMIERLDTPTKQVLIEARLLETSMNPQSLKGIDWSGTLQAQHFAFGNNLQTAPVTADSMNPPLASAAGIPKLMLDTAAGFNPATAFLNADGVSAVFAFINQNSEAKVISAPRTVTLDNEPAMISVTRASPIINVTPGTANTSGGSQINYTNLGVILNVTPRISANNQVNLTVIPEVSRVFDTITRVVNGQPFQADVYDVRRIETRVSIPSGNTLVLGGLVQDDVRKGSTKVPVLGDLPILGRAFRSDNKQRQKSNLLIFITPTIVQDSDFQPTPSDFLKSPIRETLEEDWSAWDSGKPLDWSKPIFKGDQAAKHRDPVHPEY